MAIPIITVPSLAAPTSAASLVTASLLGTATPVIYTAAVILSGAGVGLADTGSFGLTDHETVGGGSTASIGLAPAGSGDTLGGFLHANLDPHVQPVVALVGQALHG